MLAKINDTSVLSQPACPANNISQTDLKTKSPSQLIFATHAIQRHHRSARSKK